MLISSKMERWDIIEIMMLVVNQKKFEPCLSKEPIRIYDIMNNTKKKYPLIHVQRLY